MNRLFLILFFLLSGFVAFCQPTRSSTPGFSPSSNQTFVNEIGWGSMRNGLFAPRYDDTTQANVFIASLSNKDTLGNVIFSYASNSLWARVNNGSGAKKWSEVGSGGGSGTVTSIGITGADFSITNSPITTSGNIGLALATVNGNVGSFGSSTSIPSFTVNAKGLITAASGNVVIAPAGTLTGTTLASNVVTSSLTAHGTITSGGLGTGAVVGGVTMTLGSDATGDMYYRNGGGVLTKLAASTVGYVIMSNGPGVAPSYQAIPSQNIVIRNVIGAGGDSIFYISGDSLYIRPFNDATIEADGSVTIAGSGGGNVSNTGTPLNNQLAVWTNATTIEGDANLTFSSSTLGIGVAGSATGILNLSGVTSGTITIQPASAAGTYTLTLPTDDGTSNQFLQTNGSGVLTWATAAGSGDVTKVGTPVNNQLGIWTGDGTIEGDPNLTFASSTLNIGVAGSATGVLTQSGVTSGTITFQPASAAGTYTLTWPTTDGNNGEFLQTNGSGVLTWASASGSGTVNSGTQFRLAYYATTGAAVSEASAITASRALISDANGVPTHATTTSTEIEYVNGVTSAIQTQIDNKFSIALQGINFVSPADATTYYFSGYASNQTTANQYTITVDRTCTLASINIDAFSVVAGSNESWSIYVRVNNTTDHLIQAVGVSASKRRWSNNAINISLTAGDFFEIKSVTPTWATNPTNLAFAGYAIFK